MPLFIASIVAVVLSGTGLVTVVALSGRDSGPPADPPGPTGEPTTSPDVASPTPTARPTPTVSTTGQPVVDDDCVVGTWRATDVVDELITGTMTLVGEGPVYEYRADGTGEIDYGDRTLFDFAPFYGGPSNRDAVTGVRPFSYFLDNGVIEHTWENVFGGATMFSIWYFPDEETYTYECSRDEMILDGERGSAELTRLP